MGIFKNADPMVLISFIVYLAVVLAIGFYFSNKSKKMDDYFLAGRGLNSWVVAMSAQASDMSGWLLMGLPGAAYLAGLCNYWIAIGLTLGTALNWIFVAKRIRKFTYVAGDSITIPQYFQNRFKSDSPIVRIVCAAFIFIFFLVYTCSAFVTGGKLFQQIFKTGDNYANTAIIVSAVIIVTYTFLGGFNAVAWTDLIQGLIMIVAIVALPITLVIKMPELSFDTLKNIIVLSPDSSANTIGETSGFMSLLTGTSASGIASSLAWGLGYFGMPHIIVRFMAIKNSKMIKKSTIIALTWVFISLFAAVIIGVLGRQYLGNELIYVNEAGKLVNNSELIFITLVQRLFPPLLIGVFLSAVLASIMSTADSQLLVTASAIVNDFYTVVINKKASDKKQMWISRMAVMSVSVIACILALQNNKSIMNIVSNAWAGFGAAFGPAILFSVYWKRLTLKGTVAGIVGGGLTVIVWTYLLNLDGTLYSIIPGFIVSTILTVVVSLIDKKPSKDIEELFDNAISADI